MIADICHLPGRVLRKVLGPGRFWPWAAGFAAASALDWLLTRALVGDEVASEGNPLAASVLDQLGWSGLALFKVGLTALVIVLGVTVRRHRPRAGRGLVLAACVVVAVVVGYHVVLLTGLPGSRPSLARERVRGVSLDLRKRQLKDYLAKVHDLSGQIISGTQTLEQATDELAAHVARMEYVPPSFHLTADFPELSPRACLATHLVSEVGYRLRGNPEVARSHLWRLRAEFARHHAELPPFAMEWFARQDLFAEEPAGPAHDTHKG